MAFSVSKGLFLTLIITFTVQNINAQTCQVLTNSPGSFTSPGHPGNYQNFLDLCWTVEAPAGGTVSYTFTAFRIENGYDQLHIYDGQLNGASHGSFTSTQMPPPRTTSSRRLTVHFTTDFSIVFTGWRVEYEIQAPAPPTTTPEPTTTVEVTTTPAPTTTPPIEDICDRQLLIDMAPKIETIIESASRELYLMTSAHLEYEDHDFLVDNRFVKIESFPVTVHHTLVIHNMQQIAVSGRLDLVDGYLEPVGNSVMSAGGTVTGRMYPVNGHDVRIVPQNPPGYPQVETYILDQYGITETHHHITELPWYMPNWCYILAETTVAPSEESSFPWWLLFFFLIIFLIIALAAITWFIFCYRGRNKQKQEEENNNSSNRRINVTPADHRVHFYHNPEPQVIVIKR